MTSRMRVLPPTLPTWAAMSAIATTVAFSAMFLLACYPLLPDILPVRFSRLGGAIGWQWKTYTRVLMPVFVQLTLASVAVTIASLVLSRSHDPEDRDADDVQAARAAAEAIALFSLIWIAFQAYAAMALVEMWQRGNGGLGSTYGWLIAVGILLSLLVAQRANRRLGRPVPRAFVAEHWRLGQLYRNPADPALFVPTRDGSRWTLNFGRPVAAALIGVVLAIGMVAPAIILGLLLR